jgi:hypothetical protein
MFYPKLSVYTRQAAVALWQVTPFLVNLIWWISTHLLRSRREARSEQQQQLESLPWIKAIYILISVVCACTHWIAIYLINTSDLHFQTVFVPQHQEGWAMASALHFIFQVDFWIIFACTTAWCLLAVYDLRKTSTNCMALRTSTVIITLCTVFLGPGAALGLTWYYRELKMSSLGGLESKRSEDN